MRYFACILIFLFLAFPSALMGTSRQFEDKIYDPGPLVPKDSRLKVFKGDKAPDFTLRSVSGKRVTLSDFRGKQNLLLSFVPAAWTPVCSDQWPGYNIAKPLFEQKQTLLLGITVDNIPTLFAWTQQMGNLWFEVLSDFWPHGKVANAYGVLRTDGTAERALILVDKQGIIQWTHVSDINIRPDLGMIIQALDRLD
ncbi:MAG: peroxiredoxin [Desulfobacter sp.]|nr:peroxiredoxin [Desulfobacter sp.]WDP86083.1 MAG: peroxiredoxin [Desulfobacter sp.]